MGSNVEFESTAVKSKLSRAVPMSSTTFSRFSEPVGLALNCSNARKVYSMVKRLEICTCKIKGNDGQIDLVFLMCPVRSTKDSPFILPERQWADSHSARRADRREAANVLLCFFKFSKILLAYAVGVVEELHYQQSYATLIFQHQLSWLNHCEPFSSICMIRNIYIQ